MTKINVYSKDGTVKETVDLPKIFETPYRPDIIKKSFDALHANQRQPYGSDPLAGAKHATASVGKGRGMSRVPRLTQGRQAALAPCVVGGRRAHPPRVERNWFEKINKKEKEAARNSAIAATANKEIVKQRGHVMEKDITLPVVVENSFEKLTKTKDVIQTLEKIGIYDDVLRSANGKHIRAGKGKGRGRKYRITKSILIISNQDQIQKSSRNLSGVDIVTPEQLNIEHLAPGGVAGRLVVVTQETLTKLGGAK